MSLEDAAESGPAAFGVARCETVRYHEDLYASATLGQADTWLARPHRILSDALALFTGGRPVVAYDLGAGIGRHTLPMRRDLPDGSRVYAVDLLPSALEMLVASVLPGIRTTLTTRAADLDAFEFEEPADLVLAFSAIEHLANLHSIQHLLARVRAALRPGGDICAREERRPGDVAPAHVRFRQPRSVRNLAASWLASTRSRGNVAEGIAARPEVITRRPSVRRCRQLRTLTHPTAFAPPEECLVSGGRVLAG